MPSTTILDRDTGEKIPSSRIDPYDLPIHRVEVQTASGYGRSQNRWRTPVVHIIIGWAKYVSSDGRYEESFYWSVCASGRVHDVYDEVPEGCEVCQKCAETAEFEARRMRERKSPDRKKYNERTNQLLKDAEKERKNVPIEGK